MLLKLFSLLICENCGKRPNYLEIYFFICRKLLVIMLLKIYDAFVYLIFTVGISVLLENSTRVYSFNAIKKISYLAI